LEKVEWGANLEKTVTGKTHTSSLIGETLLNGRGSWDHTPKGTGNPEA